MNPTEAKRTKRDHQQAISIVLALTVAAAAWMFGAASLVDLVRPFMPKWAPWLAWALPIFCDAGLVVGVLNADRYKRLGLSPRLSAAGTGALTAVSAGAQGTHAGNIAGLVPNLAVSVAGMVLFTIPPLVVWWVADQLIELRRADLVKRDVDRAAREQKQFERDTRRSTEAAPKRSGARAPKRSADAERSEAPKQSEAKQADRSEAPKQTEAPTSEAERSEAAKHTEAKQPAKRPRRSEADRSEAPELEANQLAEARTIANIADRAARRVALLELKNRTGLANRGLATVTGINVSTVHKLIAEATRESA